MHRIASLATIWLLCSAPLARADVYRYVAEDGSLCFTDTPVSRHAELVIKERKPARSGRVTDRVPRHLAATGMRGKLSTADPPHSVDQTGSPQELPLQGRVTSSTGLRIDPIDGRLRNHNGVDIAVPTGTPVKPVAPGAVAFSGVRPGYGNMVIVDHGGGLLTVYAHHSANLVTEGAMVDQRTVIALSGSTGRSTGPHLHFEAWQDGANVTDRYQPGAIPPPAAPHRSEPLRRVVRSDGSILLTNLPLHHP